MLEINNLAGDRKFIMTRSELAETLQYNNLPFNDLDYWTKSCKCEYCNSEVDTTYINCPNCGAPLNHSRMVDRQFFYMGCPVEIIDG